MMLRLSNFSFLFISLAGFTQPSGPNNLPPPTYLRDVFTTPFEPKKYADIQGSPFLEDNWTLARIRLSKFKTIDSLLIKLNLYENRVHFKNEKGEELQIAIDFEEIKIIDPNSKWKGCVFLPGMARDNEAFFQIVTDGNMKLVKKLKINKWEVKALNEEPKKKFELQEKLFLFIDGILYKTGKSCSSLESAFGKNPAVLKFISDNDLHCNKEEELKRAVEYFNSTVK